MLVFLREGRLRGDQKVPETDVPTEKPRFSISLSHEFVERLEAYCERHCETKSKVLEELADIIIGMPEQKLDAIEKWADEEFRTVPDQVKQILHQCILKRGQ
jgi:predicted DNA-binding protein